MRHEFVLQMTITGSTSFNCSRRSSLRHLGGYNYPCEDGERFQLLPKELIAARAVFDATQQAVFQLLPKELIAALCPTRWAGPRKGCFNCSRRSSLRHPIRKVTPADNPFQLLPKELIAAHIDPMVTDVLAFRFNCSRRSSLRHPPPRRSEACEPFRFNCSRRSSLRHRH